MHRYSHAGIHLHDCSVIDAVTEKTACLPTPLLDLCEVFGQPKRPTCAHIDRVQALEWFPKMKIILVTYKLTILVKIVSCVKTNIAPSASGIAKGQPNNFFKEKWHLSRNLIKKKQQISSHKCKSSPLPGYARLPYSYGTLFACQEFFYPSGDKIWYCLSILESWLHHWMLNVNWKGGVVPF